MMPISPQKAANFPSIQGPLKPEAICESWDKFPLPLSKGLFNLRLLWIYEQWLAENVICWPVKVLCVCYTPLWSVWRGPNRWISTQRSLSTKHKAIVRQRLLPSGIWKKIAGKYRRPWRVSKAMKRVQLSTPTHVWRTLPPTFWWIHLFN